MFFNFQVEHFAQIGGDSVQEVIRKILSTILDQKLACNLNWQGRNNKKGLDGSRTAAVIRGAKISYKIVGRTVVKPGGGGSSLHPPKSWNPWELHRTVEINIWGVPLVGTFQRSNYLSEYFHSGTWYIIHLTGKVKRCSVQTMGNYDIILSYSNTFRISSVLPKHLSGTIFRKRSRSAVVSACDQMSWRCGFDSRRQEIVFSLPCGLTWDLWATLEQSCSGSDWWSCGYSACT